MDRGSAVHALLIIIPYDGKGIGSFNPDTVAIPNGGVTIYGLNAGSGRMFINEIAPFELDILSNDISDAQVGSVMANPSKFQRLRLKIARSGYETAGAWGAVAMYIQY